MYEVKDNYNKRITRDKTKRKKRETRKKYHNNRGRHVSLLVVVVGTCAPFDKKYNIIVIMRLNWSSIIIIIYIKHTRDNPIHARLNGVIAKFLITQKEV